MKYREYFENVIPYCLFCSMYHSLQTDTVFRRPQTTYIYIYNINIFLDINEIIKSHPIRVLY